MSAPTEERPERPDQPSKAGPAQDGQAKVAELRARFQELLEVAVDLRVVDPSTAAAGKAVGFPRSWLEGGHIKRARDMAKGRLTLVSSLVHGAADAVERGRNAEVLLARADKEVTRLDGYLEALKVVGLERSSMANQAKSAEADDVKERIRKSFLARRWTSKAQAAAQLAPTFSRSPSVIERYLSELFPGDAWKKVRADGEGQ